MAVNMTLVQRRYHQKTVNPRDIAGNAEEEEERTYTHCGDFEQETLVSDCACAFAKRFLSSISVYDHHEAEQV